MYTPRSTAATRRLHNHTPNLQFPAIAATADAYREADRLPPIDYGQSLIWKAVAAANRRIDGQREAERQRDALNTLEAD